MIYPHAHGDHFGGARGVLPRGAEEGVPILAPEGFAGAVPGRERHAQHAQHPDPAPARRRAHGTGDGRGTAAVARPGELLARARLLRLPLAQRQGGLPALPRLVHRQRGDPPGPPARRTRRAVRRLDGRPRGDPDEGPRLRRLRRPPLRGHPPEPPGLRRARPYGRQGIPRGGLRRARLRRGERPLAQLLPQLRDGTAPRRERGPARHRKRRDGGRPDHRDAHRLDRRPDRRPPGLGRGPHHRPGPHRRGPAPPSRSSRREALGP